MEENNLHILIEKYIRGTATAAEGAELLAWYRKYDQEKLLSPYENLQEEDDAKARVLRQLRQEIQASRPPGFRFKAVYYQVAAVAAVLLVMFFVAFKLKNRNLNPVVDYKLVSTLAGERKTITLSDGSVIWLSAKSSLRFPDAFNGPTREIALTGEAFFDIAKDKKHPFIVHTGKLSTRVLGTTFNIDAVEGHANVVVALITGKVSFSDGAAQLKLTPGLQAVYDKASKKSTTGIIPDIAAIMGRHNGIFEYDNMRVADIAEDMNRNFNLNISTKGKVKDCLFYGRVEANETPLHFLRKMAAIVNARVTENNNGYLIKGGGCN